MQVPYASPVTRSAAPDFSERLQKALPKLVLSPTLLITLVFVYGFILWTTYLSACGASRAGS
jgi:glucose/mannose transport system permease protein